MHADHDTASLEQATEDFSSARSQLFGIAYRILGSVAEAEDIVQDAWLRWQKTDRADIREPAAFLATMTTRLAINTAQSARVRRETYIGPWLPEPVDTSLDPQLGAERAEALEMAVLFLLEKLNPVERAAYVLRQAFDYPYKQIADILDSSEANARQLVSRARKHLAAEHREPATPAAHRRLLEVFLEAAKTGNMPVLEDVLAEDAVSYTDGNGARNAAKSPVFGSESIAGFLAAFAPRFWPGTETRWIEANGRPAALVSSHGKPVVLLSVEVSERGIERAMWIMNPDKLSRLATS
ncbi:RNA polymerase sigma-70 factor [Actinacidiphila rubida]|uniref:RNA polymerase sigma-70 factor, ECF subfamily n=1 Tax=Actinacidiphila rubida TaxID=310780 RepID=A0A1H8K9T7_9ACTN|nr:RNA polymerase sigma-70 factor [Actinacidiphila rubida]SEN89266.1 RNA polymerase sigma-70 factor, ECF subfamily [Actinacidiphila rubida]